MLQNAGRAVRATHVESEEALSKLLEEKVWDMMIATEEAQGLSPVDAQRLIRRQNKDIPLILLSDREGSHPCVEGIKMGARDVVRLDEDQHLLLVIDRELSNRGERETRRAAERRFHDIAKRNQLLLDSSRDAIAFVQDGMFLYTNESFAELLNYEDRDDLECLPIIDIVNSSQHDELKRFVKEFTLKGSDTETKSLTLSLIQQDGRELSIEFQIHKATYDDEACIQFLHQARNGDAKELEAQIEQIRNQDSLTGLYNKSYLLDELGSLINKAVNKDFNSALFHIGIDSFQSTVADKLGVAAIDKALANIATFTDKNVKKGDALCRYGDDSFILVVPKINAVRALERATELGRALRDHIVEIDGKTLHFNFHIGVSIINETSSNIDTPIEQSIQALEQARSKSQKDASIVSTIFEQTEEEGGEKDVAKHVQKALDTGKFKLLFQPILSLRGAEKEHYEVLLRMINDEGEEVSPNHFLEEAASIGATKKIDRWVILEATKMLANHRLNQHDTVLIIHLSKESMLDEGLAAWLSVVFKTAKLPAETIIFQLNEVDINDHLNDAQIFTKSVRDVGCSISINHFGCVLNPFKTLAEISSDYIKIDGSFTQDLQSNEEGITALNELVSELHQQDKITIVPFVESASLLSKLWQSGVHYIQGYYLQAPTDSMDYDFDMES